MDRKEIYKFVNQFRMLFSASTYEDRKEHDIELFRAFSEWEKCEKEQEENKEKKTWIQSSKE